MYRIEINTVNKLFRRLSYLFFFLMFIFWGLSYVINFPVMNLPSEMSIPYYLDFLPDWMLSIPGLCGIFFIAAIICSDISNNRSARMEINSECVLLKSRSEEVHISFHELKRITFVTRPFSLKRYRVEFIDPDMQVKKIIIRNKREFEEIMEQMISSSPDTLEIDTSTFESRRD